MMETLSVGPAAGGGRRSPASSRPLDATDTFPRRVALASLMLLWTWFLSSTFSTGALAAAGIIAAGLWQGWHRLRIFETRPTDPVGLFCVVLMAMSFFAMWRGSVAWRETGSGIYAFAESVAHAGWIGGLVLWSWRPIRGHLAMLPMICVSVLASAAAGGLRLTSNSQLSSGLVCVASLAALSMIIVQANRIRMWSHAQAITLILMLLTTWLASQVVLGSLGTIQDVFASGLRRRLDDLTNQAITDHAQYVRGDRLGSIAALLQADPQGVALLGKASSPPGYLAGFRFDSYQSGQWQARRMWWRSGFNGRTVVSLTPEGPARVQPWKAAGDSPRRFDLTKLTADDFPDDAVTAIQRLELLGVPEKGQRTFLPPNAVWIEAEASKITVNRHGIIEQGIDIAYASVVAVSNRPVRDSLSAKDRELLTSVPQSLNAITKTVSQRLCGSQPLSPRQTAALIADHFQSTGTYSLETVDRPRNVDPIEFFLRNDHPAHCELFASATVLLLRQRDVPARYVSGYVMDELSPESDDYIARNRDAHAWVEYYDDSRQIWDAVEPTPGREYLTLQPSTEEDTADLSVGLQDQSDDGRGTAWLDRVRGYLTVFQWSRWIAVGFAYGSLPGCLLYLGWLRRRQRSTLASSSKKQSHRDRVIVDRHLRRFGLVRRPQETMHAFADRLATRDEIDSALVIWYRRHADDLYRGEPQR